MATQSESPPPFRVGIPIYPSFDSLDVLGPFQVLSFLGDPIQFGGKAYRGVELSLIGPGPEDITPEIEAFWAQRFGHLPASFTPRAAAEGGYCASFESVRLMLDRTYRAQENQNLDALFVPGAACPEAPTYFGPRGNNPFFALLEELGPKLPLVTSVCNGALLVAATGLLDGYRATTHWDFRSILEDLFPQVSVAAGFPRYIIDANRVTGGGISSGLDEALALSAILAGDEVAQRIQLQIQYAPDPPFESGDPSVAPPRVVQAATAQFHDGVAATREQFCRFLRS